MPFIAAAGISAAATIGVTAMQMANQPSDAAGQQATQDAEQQAQNESTLQQQQMVAGTNIYNGLSPYDQQYEQEAAGSSAQQASNANSYENQYQSTYAPLMSQYASEAENYANPNSGMAASQQGAATADVANSYAAARTQATSNLESYGIDPSQTRYAALDLGTQVSQAAAEAGAGTQSRVNTQNQGLAMQAQAIQQGSMLPNAAAQAYAGANATGSAGVAAGNIQSSEFGALEGSPTAYGNLANSALGVQGSSAANVDKQNAANTATENQQLGQIGQGIGTLAGAGLEYNQYQGMQSGSSGGLPNWDSNTQQ